MAVEKQKQKRVERWRNKFRLVILNDDTFEELLTLRLSPLNVFTFSVFAIVFTIATTSLVIASLFGALVHKYFGLMAVLVSY